MIVVVAGVAGSGKTTIGQLVAARLGVEFADGDDFHPAANVAKMHAGIPLTDEDRWPWLDAIVAWMDERASGVVACSALHRAYREVLASSAAKPRIAFLAIPRETAEARLRTRTGHYFPRELLDSQFATLEPPAPDEPVVVIDATGTPEQVTAQVCASLATGLSARPLSRRLWNHSAPRPLPSHGSRTSRHQLPRRARNVPREG